ncbi:MAG: hypothetical protein K2K38_04460 [Clostridia bacterium]|nr:hypothetical protein [Clostridia bacterium]
MSCKKVFPKTSLKKVDVLAAEGAINVGCYNVGGKLIPALNSVSKICDTEAEAHAAWYAANIKKYVLYAGKYAYTFDETVSESTRSGMNAVQPTFIETVYSGSNAAFLVGDSAYCVITAVKNTNRPFRFGMHGSVLKNGRFFSLDNADPLKIHWSGEKGMEDRVSGISGAGWAIVQYGYGEILNLIVYKDKLVAVREFGLTFLSAYGTPENYKLSYLEQQLPKIYKNTAAVVCGRLVFYTEDGLYFYDGNKAEKCSLALAEEMQDPTALSCKDEKYFLCGKSKTLGRRAVLVYDAKLNSTYLIDFPADAIAAGERLLTYSGLAECELKTGGEFSFTSGEIDFSSTGAKVLKEVILKGAKNAKIEVSNGVISRIVGGVRGKFRPNLRGECFKITVCGSEKISGVLAVAEVMDGV